MPRFRRLNGGLWGTDEQHPDSDEEADHFPIDSDDQARLIEKFETRNYRDNQLTVSILSIIYLFCAGLFLIMATKVESRNVSSILLTGIQSIICSCVTLRYSLVNDYSLFKKIKIRISNKTIDILNCMILILIAWISTTKFEGEIALQFLFQIPLFLYITAILIKKWSTELDRDLNKLRGLKYKYKNA